MGIDYRKLAFEKYAPICVMCGFGIREVLEVAHLNGDRSNCEISNLAILCPNCHKMHDIDLISTRIVLEMCDEKKKVNWTKRIKDAGRRAAETKRKYDLSAIAKKAVATRRKNQTQALVAQAQE